MSGSFIAASAVASGVSTIPAPSGTTSGDQLLLHIMISPSNTATLSGWTLRSYDSSANNRHAFFVKLSTGESSFSIGTSHSGAHMATYRGVTNLAASGDYAEASGTPAAVPAPSVAAGFEIGFMTYLAGAGLSASGWTNDAFSSATAWGAVWLHQTGTMRTLGPVASATAEWGVTLGPASASSGFTMIL